MSDIFNTLLWPLGTCLMNFDDVISNEVVSEHYKTLMVKIEKKVWIKHESDAALPRNLQRSSFRSKRAPQTSKNYRSITGSVIGKMLILGQMGGKNEITRQHN